MHVYYVARNKWFLLSIEFPFGGDSCSELSVNKYDHHVTMFRPDMDAVKCKIAVRPHT